MLIITNIALWYKIYWEIGVEAAFLMVPSLKNPGNQGDCVQLKYLGSAVLSNIASGNSFVQELSWNFKILKSYLASCVGFYKIWRTQLMCSSKQREGILFMALLINLIMAYLFSIRNNISNLNYFDHNIHYQGGLTYDICMQ